MIKRRFQIAAIIFSAMLCLTGCGGEKNYSYTSSTTDTYSGSGIKMSDYGTNSTFVNMEVVPDTGITKANNTEIAKSEYSDTENVISDRKLIRTVDLTAKIENSRFLTDTISNIISMVSECNGYTEDQFMENGYSSYGRITARIPKNQTDIFLEMFKDMEGLSMTEFSDNLEDVTLQYVDVESRLQSSKAAKDRYMAMLEKADTVTDILSIQERLDEIIADEESYQRTLSSMDSQIEYTTVSIRINCKINEEKQTFWDLARESFLELMDTAGETFFTAVLWFVSSLIWLVFALPIMFIVIRAFLFATGKRRNSKKNSKRKTEDTQTPMT